MDSLNSLSFKKLKNSQIRKLIIKYQIIIE